LNPTITAKLLKISAARSSFVSRQLPAALDRYPHGFTGHVAHPIRSIVNRYRLLARRIKTNEERGQIYIFET